MRQATFHNTTSPAPLNGPTVYALHLLKQYWFARMTESDAIALLISQGLRLSDLNRTPAELLRLRRAH